MGASVRARGARERASVKEKREEKRAERAQRAERREDRKGSESRRLREISEMSEIFGTGWASFLKYGEQGNEGPPIVNREWGAVKKPENQKIGKPENRKI